MFALEIERLTKSYKNGTQALKGISFCVERGDFYALLGHNGAGKSTTIGIISSLVDKTSGSVKVFGLDLDREPRAVKRQIGLVPQEFNFNQMDCVWDILLCQAGFYGVPRHEAKLRAEKWLKALDLWEKRTSRIRELSGGMKRRVMIARALMHEPKLLILDEPTAGVDIELRRSLWTFLEALNREGLTIILTTHYLEEAESHCRHIGIIQQGELIEHTTMKALLAKLQTETFVLDLDAPIALNLPTYQLNWLDDTRLEVEIAHNQGCLTDLFLEIARQGAKIVSLRNKYNRLEELFLQMGREGN